MSRVTLSILVGWSVPHSMCFRCKRHPLHLSVSSRRAKKPTPIIAPTSHLDSWRSFRSSSIVFATAVFHLPTISSAPRRSCPLLTSPQGAALLEQNWWPHEAFGCIMGEDDNKPSSSSAHVKSSDSDSQFSTLHSFLLLVHPCIAR